MKLLLCSVLLALTIGALAKDDKDQMLLGADDVDKKHAEMSEDSKLKPPSEIHTVKEAKKRVKDDKKELKELQDRARALKEQLRDSKQMTKSEKKVLKKSFRDAKKDLHAKKQEISSLKSEIKVLKASEKQPPTLSPISNEGKKGGKHKNKGGRKQKLQLIGAEESKINNPGTAMFGLQSEPVVEEPVLSKKEQKKLMRKMSRKAGRKQKKKNKKHGTKDISDMMVTEDRPKLRTGLVVNDAPKIEVAVHSGKKHRGRKGRRGHRIPCTTDADCLNGAMCFENRKGHKFCKGNGMDKTAGKKCHRSEQCARGLMCFVKNTDVGTGKHHKRKGMCADPETADLTKGSFMPFHTTTK